MAVYSSVRVQKVFETGLQQRANAFHGRRGLFCYVSNPVSGSSCHFRLRPGARWCGYGEGGPVHDPASIILPVHQFMTAPCSKGLKALVKTNAKLRSPRLALQLNRLCNALLGADSMRIWPRYPRLNRTFLLLHPRSDLIEPCVPAGCAAPASDSGARVVCVSLGPRAPSAARPTKAHGLTGILCGRSLG